MRAPGSSPLVLVVDDDSDILESIAELLMEEGYRTLTARDGQEALDLLRGAKELPSLIILDMMMPRKDGAVFRTEQMADPILAPIPVVVMSASRHVESTAAALGITHQLKKPLELDDIVRIVGELT